MKVLIVTRTLAFGGGAESLVYNTYNKLKERLGTENVKLVSFQHSSIFKFDNIDLYEKALINDSNFNVLKLKAQFRIFKKNQIEITQLDELVNDFEPDIIHTHLFLTEFISRNLNYSKAKWFSHFHDNIEQFENLSLKTFFNKKRLINYIEKRFLFRRYKLNGGNSFIAISDDTFKYANKTTEGYPVHLLQNAIDCSRFYKNEKSLDEKINIINIGNFSENKNQGFLIEVAKQLIDKNKNIYFTLIGYGPTREALIEKVKELKLDDNIHFPGAVLNVEEYLSNSHLYVHTAKKEAFGLVLAEAMASGLPVIAYDTPGVRDVVKDRENGFLIDRFNLDTFIEKINLLIQDANLYSLFSENGLSDSKQFDFSAYIENLIIIYANALKK